MLPPPRPRRRSTRSRSCSTPFFCSCCSCFHQVVQVYHADQPAPAVQHGQRHDAVLLHDAHGRAGELVPRGGFGRPRHDVAHRQVEEGVGLFHEAGGGPGGGPPRQAPPPAPPPPPGPPPPPA